MVISYSQLPLLRTPSARELVSLLVRVHNSRNLFHLNVCHFLFCKGFSCSPYYWDVRNSKVSARQELTVFTLQALKTLRIHLECLSEGGRGVVLSIDIENSNAVTDK